MSEVTLHLEPLYKKSINEVWVIESECETVRIRFYHNWRWGRGAVQVEEDELQDYLDCLDDDFEEVKYTVECWDGCAFDWEITTDDEELKEELDEYLRDNEDFDVWMSRDEEVSILGMDFSCVYEGGEVYGPYKVIRMNEDEDEDLEVLKVVGEDYDSEE